MKRSARKKCNDRQDNIILAHGCFSGRYLLAPNVEPQESDSVASNISVTDGHMGGSVTFTHNIHIHYILDTGTITHAHATQYPKVRCVHLHPSSRGNNTPVKTNGSDEGISTIGQGA